MFKKKKIVFLEIIKYYIVQIKMIYLLLFFFFTYLIISILPSDKIYEIIETMIHGKLYIYLLDQNQYANLKKKIKSKLQ